MRLSHCARQERTCSCPYSRNGWRTRHRQRVGLSSQAHGGARVLPLPESDCSGCTRVRVETFWVTCLVAAERERKVESTSHTHADCSPSPKIGYREIGRCMGSGPTIIRISVPVTTNCSQHSTNRRDLPMQSECLDRKRIRAPAYFELVSGGDPEFYC